MALTLTASSLIEQSLYEWATKLIQRFPRYIDFRLIKGLYAILGPGASPSFLKERSVLHLKRLLLTQFFLQKKMEENLSAGQNGSHLIKVFPIDSILCVAVTYDKRENTLKEEAILEIVDQKIPTLKKINTSLYQWDNQDPSYAFFYLELEKMRGKDPLVSEIKELESHLKTELCHYLSETSVFWPYNHEEAFKQLLILAKEISSSKDYPQVSIHFQRQTTQYLEFLIYLARPKRPILSETRIVDDHLHSLVQLTTHLKRELNSNIPTQIEAFSLLIPIEKCKSKGTINLLYAREFIAKLLENIIGEFRDYNGGLFEQTKRKFREIYKASLEMIPNFDLFGEDLFHSLKPVEAQICLSNTIFKDVLKEVSHALQKPAPSLNQSNVHNVHIAVFKFQNSNHLNSHLSQAKTLHQTNKITAYAHVKILDAYYLCLINEQGKKIEAGLLSLHSEEKKKKLHLSFEAKALSSLDPYYIHKELRGTTIVRLLYEPLFRLNPKNQLTYAACKEMKLSKNGTDYLFTVRPFHWSNGEEVTACDYEKTWKRNFLQGVSPNLFYNLKDANAIKNGEKTIDDLGVKAVDERHLKVELENKDPSFLNKLTSIPFFPVLTNSIPRAFNGPFLVTKQTDKFLILEKNPYYWETKKIFFNRIETSFGHHPQEIHDLFNQKKTDWLGTSCSYEIDLPPTYKKREAAFFFFVYFNTECFPLSSPYIRQALSYAIDRKWIVDHCFPKSTPISSFIAEQDSSTNSAPSFPYDLLKAKKLFEKGLEELGLTKETFPSLRMISSNSKHGELSQYLKKKWESTFQIQVNLTFFDWDSFYREIERHHFQIGGFLNYFCSIDSVPFLDSFARKQDNLSSWENLEYSKTIKGLKNPTSLQKRKNLLRKANAILESQMPLIPIFKLTHRYTHSSGLKDYVFNPDGSIDFRFAQFSSSESLGVRRSKISKA